MASLSGNASMRLGVSIRPLIGTGSAARLHPAVLSLIHEAGNPYFDWFFGGAENAIAALGRWMRRSSSEVAIGRVRVALAGERLIGMFLALGGDEVERCRRADLLAATQDAAGNADARAELVRRLAESRGLFAPVGADELYLSKMGVVRHLRGMRLGRELTEAYLASGRATGVSRFRLDVSAANQAAVALYRSVGFEVMSATECAGMTYLAMVRDES